MKGLAIDSAISQITIAAKNDDKCVTATYNIGMKQSETLLPAIQYVLEKAELSPNQLEYLAICKGPGSFTGLRLGFSALKAIQMATNAPLYAWDTLDVYTEAYKNFDLPILSCIDAKKDRFYVKCIKNEKEVFPEGDYTPEKIVDLIQANISEDKILICGSDALILSQQLNNLTSKKLINQDFNLNIGEILLKMTESKISKGEKPINDYDGPYYLRASEAEVKLNS